MKKGWDLCTLGNTFATVTGSTPSKSKTEFYGDDIPFVKPPELLDSQVENSKDSLSEEGRRVARVAPSGSILISCIGNLGKIGIAKCDVAFNQQINAILPDQSRAHPKFMFYQALSPLFRSQLDSLATGTTVSIVNKSRFNSIEVVLPPLDEQKRIVSILDQAFECLDRARANAEANLESAKELFESYIDYLFRDVSGWSNLPIGELGSVFDGPHATPKTVNEGPLFLGISLLQDGKIVLDKTRHLSDEDYQKWTKRVTPTEGDVVFSYETRLGQIGLIPAGMMCALGRRMGLVRLDKSKTLPEYFVACYLSPGFQSFLRQKTVRGATVDRISIKDFPSFPFPVPNISEQKLIVAKINNFRNEHERIIAASQASIDNVDDLRQSLLKKAFSGKLT